MEGTKPQTEDKSLSYLAMPLTKQMKLKRKRQPKVKMNQIFKTNITTPLNPVCKTTTKEIKKYEVRGDKTPLNQFW